MKIIASDFDNTLFKRYHGLINDTVDYLTSKSLPVYIVTYRAPNQQGFILDTLAGTGLEIVGIAFADSRKQDYTRKLDILQWLSKNFDIEEVLDDDERVVLGWNQGF